MAKLDNTERKQLQAPPRPGCAAPPPPPALAPREYVAFATFAARFLPATKPRPAFGGRHWKL